MDEYNDDENLQEAEDEIPLMPKLDIDRILRDASCADALIAADLSKQTNDNAVDTANEEWASQFIGNHTMMQHIIDEKIKRGEVPEFRKRRIIRIKRGRWQ